MSIVPHRARIMRSSALIENRASMELDGSQDDEQFDITRFPAEIRSMIWRRALAADEARVAEIRWTPHTSNDRTNLYRDRPLSHSWSSLEAGGVPAYWPDLRGKSHFLPPAILRVCREARTEASRDLVPLMRDTISGRQYFIRRGRDTLHICLPYRRDELHLAHSGIVKELTMLTTRNRRFGPEPEGGDFYGTMTRHVRAQQTQAAMGVDIGALQPYGYAAGNWTTLLSTWGKFQTVSDDCSGKPEECRCKTTEWAYLPKANVIRQEDWDGVGNPGAWVRMEWARERLEARVAQMFGDTPASGPPQRLSDVAVLGGVDYIRDCPHCLFYGRITGLNYVLGPLW